MFTKILKCSFKGARMLRTKKHERTLTSCRLGRDFMLWLRRGWGLVKNSWTGLEKHHVFAWSTWLLRYKRSRKTSRRSPKWLGFIVWNCWPRRTSSSCLHLVDVSPVEITPFPRPPEEKSQLVYASSEQRHLEMYKLYIFMVCWSVQWQHFVVVYMFYKMIQATLREGT